MCLFMVIAAYGVIALGILSLSSKLIGLELSGVLQLAYFSLIEHNRNVNVYVNWLSKLANINGYNIVFIDESK